MLNRIVLIGRLTADASIRYTPNGKAVTTFTLAVDRQFKNQQGEKEVDFVNIVAWGSLAELCANYLSKGKLAACDGRLQIRSFDGQDGQKRWVTEVVADNVRFLSPKEQAHASEGGNSPGDNEEIPF